MPLRIKKNRTCPAATSAVKLWKKAVSISSHIAKTLDIWKGRVGIFDTGQIGGNWE